MADTKISALSTLTKATVATNDSLPIVDTSASATKQITYQELVQPQDDQFAIADNADNTKKVAFQVSGVTTGTTRTLTVPDANTTIVGTDATQTLTNKTLTSPTINLGTNATGDIYYRDSGGAFQRLPIGTAGQILDVSAGGIPEWIANPAAASASYSTAGVMTTDANVRYYAADASGSSTAYTATMSPAPSAYVTGQNYRVKFVNANTTTTPTLNLNGLGAKTIVKGVSTALAVGDIAANMVCDLHYDGTNFVLLNPTNNSVTAVGKINVTTTDTSTTATTADVLTASIPANTLGTNGGVYGKIYFTWASTTITAKQVLLKYGSTTIATISMTPDATTSTTQRGYIDFVLLANNATNTQEGSISIVGMSNATGIFRTTSNTVVPIQGFEAGTSAEDSTTTLNLKISIAQNAAAGDTFTMVHGFVKNIS